MPAFGGGKGQGGGGKGFAKSPWDDLANRGKRGLKNYADNVLDSVRDSIGGGLDKVQDKLGEEVGGLGLGAIPAFAAKKLVDKGRGKLDDLLDDGLDKVKNKLGEKLGVPEEDVGGMSLYAQQMFEDETGDDPTAGRNINRGNLPSLIQNGLDDFIAGPAFGGGSDDGSKSDAARYADDGTAPYTDMFDQDDDDDDAMPYGGGEDDDDEDDENYGNENEAGGGRGGKGEKGKDNKPIRFDTEFIKKYYSRIRHHPLIKPKFDALNLKASAKLLAFVTVPTVGLDHVLVFLKPKYANPKYKLDAIIEFLLIDEGPINAMISPLEFMIDELLQFPVIKEAGDAVIAACKLAGIFNNTLMKGANMVNKHKANKNVKAAKKKVKDQAKADGRKATRKDYNKDKDVKSARDDAKIGRGDYRADRARHGLSTGFNTEMLRTAGTQGLKAAAKAKLKGTARGAANSAGKSIAGGDGEEEDSYDDYDDGGGYDEAEYDGE